MEASPVTTTTLTLRAVLFSPEEELALVGFLAGYSGLTRDAYALDLPLGTRWLERRVCCWEATNTEPVTGSRRSER